MPRPVKPRRVCCMPESRMFVPHPVSDNAECVIITVDEFEVFRLMDYVGMSQEECSKSMGVARTTVQKIYSDARSKIAEAMVTSKIIKIEGGDFTLYNDQERKNSPGRCHRHRCRKR